MGAVRVKLERMSGRAAGRGKTVQISVRIAAADLAELERLGAAAKPVPVNRNQMIGVAVREYVERHVGRPAPSTVKQP